LNKALHRVFHFRIHQIFVTITDCRQR